MALAPYEAMPCPPPSGSPKMSGESVLERGLESACRADELRAAADLLAETRLVHRDVVAHGIRVSNDIGIVRLREPGRERVFAISFLSEEVRTRHADVRLAHELIELAVERFFRCHRTVTMASGNARRRCPWFHFRRGVPTAVAIPRTRGHRRT